MNNGKQSEQLLKVLGGHSASLDRTSKCRGLSEQPLYSGGHKVFVLTYKFTVILFVAKSKGSLMRLEYPKPRYKPSLSH